MIEKRVGIVTDLHRFRDIASCSLDIDNSHPEPISSRCVDKYRKYNEKNLYPSAKPQSRAYDLTSAITTNTSSRPSHPLCLIVVVILQDSRKVAIMLSEIVTHRKSLCSSGYALKIIMSQRVR